MCKWGTDTICRVNVDAKCSHTGKARWADKAVDSCLADIVNALNAANILTGGSCCGHGKGEGNISLQDGRVLVLDHIKNYSTCAEEE